MRLGSNVVYLAHSHGNFLRDLLTVEPGEGRMRWRTEIWPLQWRIGVQGALSWFHLSLFVPVLFYYHGPGEAGQFGMTWHIVALLQVAATAQGGLRHWYDWLDRSRADDRQLRSTMS